MSEQNNNNHVAEQIEAYLDAELSLAERIAFDKHIAACESCRLLLEESRQTRAELQSLFEAAQPNDTFEDRLIEGLRMGTSRRLHWIQPSVRRAAFAAAAAVLLVGAGITVSQSLAESDRRVISSSTTSQITSTVVDHLSDFNDAPVLGLDNLQRGLDRKAGQSDKGKSDDGSRNAIARQGEIRYQISSNLDQSRSAISNRNWAEAQISVDRARLAANTDPTLFNETDVSNFRKQVDQSEAELKRAQEAYVQSAGAAQAASIDRQISESRSTADLQRQRTVDDLVRTSKDLINHGKYQDALRTNEQILTLNKNDDYAVGIRPLLQDKVELQQFAMRQDGRIPQDDTLRYPTGLADSNKVASTKDRTAQPQRGLTLALPMPVQKAEEIKAEPDVVGKEIDKALQSANKKGAAADALVASLKSKLQESKSNPNDPEPAIEEKIASQPAALGRKIIRNAQMQFEVERFDDAQLRISKLVADDGGFVAGTDSDKLPNGKMKGTITLRVPPERLDALVLELRGIGDLKSQKIGAEDVTRHYTDLESSLRAAHAMQDRLLEIIKSGKGQIKDLLEAEKQLGIWREKSEQIEGEKRYLDNLVTLSTLTLEVAERDIRQAAVATESEQVDMSLETEAVDKAYAKAREVIETAKGRILQSEMKQLDAGQFGATIRAAVPPDVAEQVIAGLRQLNGRIAHFSRESHRTTQEGDAHAAAANTVRHDDAIIAIQIYNLANIAPRRTTNVVIAMTDVEKAYQKLLADVRSAGGQVLTSSLTRPDSNQQTGEIQVQLPADKADALELSAASLGETLRHDSTENPDGANVTDAKRGFHFTIVSSTTIAARETRQIALVATAVGSTFDSIRQVVTDAGGRITQSELNDQGADGQSAVLSFDLPRTSLPTVTSSIDKSAVLLSQSAARSPDTQNTLDSKVRFSLTITGAQKLAPRQTIALGSEVSDVNAAVTDLTTAADAAGGRRVDSGGVSQDHATTTAEVTIDVPADRAQAILDKLEHGGRTFNKRVTFDPNAPQGALSRARIQATFSDSARGLGGQESGWDALRHGLETSAAGLRWSLQMLVIGACFIAPWVFVLWIGWKLLRRKPRKVVTA